MKHNLLASKQARIEHIDLLRMVGIVLMIAGHIGFGSLFNKWIHAFHMPLFFIVSGYLFKKYSIQECLLRSLKSLFLPYVVLGLFHWLIYSLINKSIDLDYLYILFIDNSSGLYISGAIWFLPVLFVVVVSFNIIKMYIYNNWILYVLLALVSLLGNIIPSPLPYHFDAAMVGIGLYCVGYYLRNSGYKLLSLNPIISIVVLFVCSILAILNSSVNMRTGHYGNIILFWLNAVGITISLWNLAKSFHGLIKGNQRLIKVTNKFLVIGRDSIVFLGLNQLMILFFSLLFDYCIPNSNGVVLLVRQFVILFSVIISLYFVDLMIMKTKIKRLFGIWRD